MRASLDAFNVVVAPDDIKAASDCHRVLVGLTSDCRYTHFSYYVMHPRATQKVCVGLTISHLTLHTMLCTSLHTVLVISIRPLLIVPESACTSMWNIRAGPEHS